MPSKIRIDRRKPKHRLPKEVVELLRRKGGAHSTKKGKRGYDRREAKRELRRRGDDRESGPPPFLCSDRSSPKKKRPAA